jgi:hypothetical protein
MLSLWILQAWLSFTLSIAITASGLVSLVTEVSVNENGLEKLPIESVL